MGYEIARVLSWIIRWVICYFTIETTPIFENSLIAYGVDQIISLYTVLWFVSYTIVGRVFNYKSGSAPVLGVMLYAIIYIPLALLTWGILAILTALGVLPL
ncbi:hypothetical protein A2791_02195 [Candidatus Saccharibacteria bacterium RIFCSPHIGHO2_01_FULL_46_30]|nr:MAG: hypothetical protein A2791_02195 [Candidatus Saccharibacteria bacterium RIFCSPHIGHO2_01_FULL_46_30]